MQVFGAKVYLQNSLVHQRCCEGVLTHLLWWLFLTNVHTRTPVRDATFEYLLVVAETPNTRQNLGFFVPNMQVFGAKVYLQHSLVHQRCSEGVLTHFFLCFFSSVLQQTYIHVPLYGMPLLSNFSLSQRLPTHVKISVFFSRTCKSSALRCTSKTHLYTSDAVKGS